MCSCEQMEIVYARMCIWVWHRKINDPGWYLSLFLLEPKLLGLHIEAAADASYFQQKQQKKRSTAKKEKARYLFRWRCNANEKLAIQNLIRICVVVIVAFWVSLFSFLRDLKIALKLVWRWIWNFEMALNETYYKKQSPHIYMYIVYGSIISWRR